MSAYTLLNKYKMFLGFQAKHAIYMLLYHNNCILKIRIIIIKNMKFKARCSKLLLSLVNKTSILNINYSNTSQFFAEEMQGAFFSQNFCTLNYICTSPTNDLIHPFITGGLVHPYQ